MLWQSYTKPTQPVLSGSCSMPSIVGTLAERADINPDRWRT